MTYVNVELRRIVTQRAGNCCEYCRISREDMDGTFHVEHIIAVSHGGKTVEENLCLSCPQCNLLKGSNIAAADPVSGDPAFMFHPRRHHWDEHFRLNGVLIEPQTPEGRVTTFVLRLNSLERLTERELLQQAGRYPCIPL